MTEALNITHTTSVPPDKLFLANKRQQQRVASLHSSIAQQREVPEAEAGQLGEMFISGGLVNSGAPGGSGIVLPYELAQQTAGVNIVSDGENMLLRLNSTCEREV